MADIEKKEPAAKADAQVNMGKWISSAWDLVTKDLGLFILLTLIYVVVMAVASYTVVGGIVLAGPLTVGIYIILLNKLKGEEVQVGQITKGFGFFVPALLSTIVVTVFVSIGFLLLIIPGIIVSAMYIFVPILIVEKNMDFWTAMETSRKLASQKLFEMSVFVLVLGLITVAGALVCGVGVLVAYPIVFAAVAFAYDDFVGIDGRKK